jgi:hypothetical protein
MGRNRKTYSETSKKEVAVEALKEKTPVAENSNCLRDFPELGSLAVEYLSHLLQKDSLEQLDTLTPLHLVIAESSAFTE